MKTKVVKKTVTVKEIIALLKKGKKVTTVNGVAHRLSYCEKVADKNAEREVKIAA